MRVLHFLQSNMFSGAENVVCQIISMFKDEDIEFIYSSRDGQIREALKERDIKFEPISKMSISEFKRVIKKTKPDVIHAHDMGASFLAALAANKIPVISHIHNNNFNSQVLSAKSIAYFIAAMKAKHIFWVSQSSFDSYAFHKKLKNKSSVLYNVIDIDSLYQKMENDKNQYDYDIIYIGRLTYPKNPERLMRVCEKVIEKIPNVKIGIVGSGDLLEETMSLCRELKLQNNVKFLGFQSNPLKMLHDAKAMIMTSRWEGTPMCALEAIALGVPIVSAPTDGICELVENGKNGFLSDDDNILAQRLADIVSDDALYLSLHHKAREKSIILNDVKAYKKSILEIYKKSLTDKLRVG